MRVQIFVVGDADTASTRYRVLELLPYLRASDISCDVISLKRLIDHVPGPKKVAQFAAIILLGLKAIRSDVTYVQKVPLPSVYLKLLDRIAGPVVYDFDDAIYTTPRWKDGTNNRWANALPKTLQSVTAVVAGSPTLAEYARQYADCVYSLPTGIPAEEYENRPNRKGGNDTIVIGWIGNPPNLHYLASIEGSLRTVLDEHDDVRLSVITSGDLPVVPLEERRGDDVVYREWSLDRELEYLSEVDIAIRPLFDDEWTRAKGGFTSVVQCMALKIPVVVTPVSMLENIVEHGVSGYHAEDENEWVKYLSLLIDDRKRRIKMGGKAFIAIDRAGFWSEKRAEELINILEELD